MALTKLHNSHVHNSAPGQFLKFSPLLYVVHSTYYILTIASSALWTFYPGKPPRTRTNSHGGSFASEEERRRKKKKEMGSPPRSTSLYRAYQGNERRFLQPVYA